MLIFTKIISYKNLEQSSYAVDNELKGGYHTKWHAEFLFGTNVLIRYGACGVHSGCN